MKRSIVSLLAVCVFSSLTALSVLAQAPAQPPPRVLRIYREDVKHGMSERTPELRLDGQKPSPKPAQRTTTSE